MSGGFWLRVVIVDVCCRIIARPRRHHYLAGPPHLGSIFLLDNIGCEKSLQGLHYGHRFCVSLKLHPSIEPSWSHWASGRLERWPRMRSEESRMLPGCDGYSTTSQVGVIGGAGRDCIPPALNIAHVNQAWTLQPTRISL